jgi:hypothetical protein
MLPRPWLAERVSRDPSVVEEVPVSVPVSSAAHGSARSGPARRAVVAVFLVLLAVICFAFYLVLNSNEDHSFNAGATPPSTVALTQGKLYEISTPGGVGGLKSRGLNPASIACTYSVGGGASAPLTVTALGADTRTTHAMATFNAPLTGSFRIGCSGLTAGVFVDDSDDGSGDPAGLMLLLSVVAAGLAVAVGMSYLYRRSTPTNS